LILKSANRKAINWVIYRLDESSYAEPVRPAENRKDDFRETISSYGDYLVTASVQIGPERFVQKAWLSELLRAGHETDLSSSSCSSIQQALQDIEAN
jgi:hypothetical protein